MTSATLPRSFAPLLMSFAESLRARRGWKRLATAFAAGIISAFAFPPFNAAPVLFLCFPALIFLLQGTPNLRSAFLTGWAFAFGFGLVSFYWIAGALFVDIGEFWWVLPFAVCGLPAAFAIYYGLAAALAKKIGLRGLSGAAALALCWFLADYARGHLFTGFPWDVYGYAWADFLPLLQIASVIGIYGLTLLTLLIATVPAALAENPLPKNSARIVLAGFAAFALIAAWGTWRMETASRTTVPDLRVRLVQPAASQRMKWKTELAEQNFGELLDLSSAPSSMPGEKPVTHIIWPETAALFYLAEDPVHRAAAAALVPENGALITGVIRRDFTPDRDARFYNSLVAVDHEKNITAVYDKFHLVPFGEYVPLRKYMPLRALTALGVDFSAGPGPRTLRIKNFPAFSPLICYEAIFPGEVADRTDPPQLLLNITNDGWYDHTTGPLQHIYIARVRAVEEGVPLIRAANRGFNAVIDPYGFFVAKMGWNKAAYIDSDIPQPLHAPTLFGLMGDRTLWLLFSLIAAAIGVNQIRHAQRSK